MMAARLEAGQAAQARSQIVGPITGANHDAKKEATASFRFQVRQQAGQIRLRGKLGRDFGQQASRFSKHFSLGLILLADQRPAKLANDLAAQLIAQDWRAAILNRHPPDWDSIPPHDEPDTIVGFGLGDGFRQRLSKFERYDFGWDSDTSHQSIKS
jgi:hypothetical protein